MTCEVPACDEDDVDTLVVVFSRPPQLIRMCGRHIDEFQTPVELAPPRTGPQREPIAFDDEETL